MNFRTLLLATSLIIPVAAYSADMPAKADKADASEAKAHDGADADTATATAQEYSVSRKRSIPFHGSPLA